MKKTMQCARMRAALERVRSYLREYCSCSGVHGFRYLSEGSRNVFERYCLFPTDVHLSHSQVILLCPAMSNFDVCAGYSGSSLLLQASTAVR